jgi:hypothetical protein
MAAAKRRAETGGFRSKKQPKLAVKKRQFVNREQAPLDSGLYLPRKSGRVWDSLAGKESRLRFPAGERHRYRGKVKPVGRCSRVKADQNQPLLRE